MSTNYPLRLYANPVKQILLLLTSAVFVSIGLLMLQDPKMRADAFMTTMAYVAIIFFGLGVAVFLIMILRYTVFRLPVLQIDAQRWTYRPPLAGKVQAVPWQNIRSIALLQQQASRTSMYTLVVYAKDPQQLPHHPRAQAFTESFYLALSGAALFIPLNTLFVRTTPANSKRLLERIVSACAHDIQLHRVQVSAEMYDM